MHERSIYISKWISQDLPVFGLLSIFGYLLGLGTAFLLAAYLGLAMQTVVEITLIASLTFFLILLLRSVFLHDQDLIYYHHQWLTLLAVGLYLYFSGYPLWDYLDIWAAAIAMIVIWGRTGCTFAGCCHGKPASWGIRYGYSHLWKGFPRYYLNVPLLPVQQVESGWVTLVLLFSIFYRLDSMQAGTLFCLYMLFYSFGRYFLEQWRGDQDRPYFLGLSEAQWIAFFSIWVISFCAAGFHLLPFYLCIIPVVAVSLSCLLAVLNYARNPILCQMSQPKHLFEITDIILHFPADQLYTTSVGLSISSGIAQMAHVQQFHVTISGLGTSRAGRRTAKRLFRHVFTVMQLPIKQMSINNTRPGVYQAYCRQHL